MLTLDVGSASRQVLTGLGTTDCLVHGCTPVTAGDGDGVLVGITDGLEDSLCQLPEVLLNDR